MATTAFNTANAQHLTVRFSGPADVPAVLNFYKANLHENVDYRGDFVFRDRVETGRALLVFKSDGSLAMSSMSHPFYNSGNPALNGDRVEIGSTLASQEKFGLYPFVIASQVVHEFLDRAPSEVFFACIHKENTAVSSMLQNKVGWNITTPTQEFADSVGEGANIAKLSWLTADSDTLGHQSRVVLDMMDRGTATNKKTGETLKLDLTRFSLAGTFRAAVEELGHGRFGEMLEHSRPIPLKTARAAYEKYRAGARFFPEFSSKP